MDKLPVISIIVPVYNMEDYLEECLQSIANQIFQDFEVLLVDDGSTDGSALIAKHWVGCDRRFRYFHKPNGGLSAARNYGIDRARGDYLGFVDSDDWVEPDFYELLYNQAIKHNAQMSTCGFIKVSERSEIAFTGSCGAEIVYTPEDGIRAMFEKDKMRYSACDKLFLKDLFQTVRFPENIYYEDKATLYQLMHLCKKIVFNSATKYHYYVRMDSIMHRSLDYHHFDLFAVNEKLIVFLEKHYPNLVMTANESYAEECFRLLERIDGDLEDWEKEREKCLTIYSSICIIKQV